MKVREHMWVAGRCLHCGAKDLALLADEWHAAGNYGDPNADERQCIEREDYIGPRLCPEPSRRQFAHEDAEFISQRLRELEVERRPKCPITQQEVSVCLRGGKCPERCPHAEYWTGPQPDDVSDAGAYC